jgi:hypothetical protein
MPDSLCRTCAHCKTIVSGKGSRFLLCEVALQDRRFAKYPPQPVLACAGYTVRLAKPQE